MLLGASRDAVPMLPACMSRIPRAHVETEDRSRRMTVANVLPTPEWGIGKMTVR
jgi:hypothetical protein